MTTSTIATQYNVTDSQIAAAHRYVDCNKHITFYMVESATTPGIEYRVYYNRELKHLVCNCAALGPCWHRRAALAATAEFKAERAELEAKWMAELQSEIDAESREYSIVVDETSSSLDGIKWETAPSGRLVPMR